MGWLATGRVLVVVLGNVNGRDSKSHYVGEEFVIKFDFYFNDVGVTN